MGAGQRFTIHRVTSLATAMMAKSSMITSEMEASWSTRQFQTGVGRGQGSVEILANDRNLRP